MQIKIVRIFGTAEAETAETSDSTKETTIKIKYASVIISFTNDSMTMLH